MRAAQTLAFCPFRRALLTEMELGGLHVAAPEVLQLTGIRSFRQPALEMLWEAGATIADRNRVKIAHHHHADQLLLDQNRDHESDRFEIRLVVCSALLDQPVDILLCS